VMSRVTRIMPESVARSGYVGTGFPEPAG